MKLKLYYAALAAFLLALFSFGVFTSTPAAPPVDRALFVRGFVAVPVGATATIAAVKRREIALPSASVFLVRASAPTVPIASALTDLSGRFGIKTTERGVFMLCVEAPGFVRSCQSKEFALRSQSERRGTLLISPMREKDGATAYGNVKLADGSKPRGFEPMMGVNAFATVNLKTASGAKYMGYVNNFGEYIVPSVPVTEDFALRVDIDKESRELKINKRTNLVPQRDYAFDFEFRNSAPRIRLTSASANGKKVQIAAPGATITVKAVAEDRDADKLIYRWSLPDGNMVGPTNDPELKWTLPGRKGRHSLTVLVSDDRGGYVRDTYTVVATTGGVPFGGSVVDDAGAPIAGAQIDVNGRLISTNTRGRFNYEVPVADTYVMTIRKAGIEAPNLPSYGTASYVYTGAMPGGKWTLRRAKVFTVDPTLPITVQHTRTEKDCVGPVGSHIDWTPYLGAGLIEWQDGKGNARALREIAKKSPADVQRVTRLLARNNAALANHMVKQTGVKGEIRDTRLSCRSGISVQIPANSLIDPKTGIAPAGKVQIAMSAIDLSASQMPGDFSATDTTGKVVSMESFGAGSIEIGNGTQRFNLKPGANATVTIPVDATQLQGGAMPAPTIPFLYYDEASGKWTQDGVATRVGSGAAVAYVKKVRHFSTMNADILKQGQACVAVEVDPTAGFVFNFDVEVTMPPSVVNPNVIQVRTLSVDTLKTNVIYNLPLNTNIVLTPIVNGTKPDGSTGPVPAGVFVVNTGGPMNSVANPPTPNGDGTYYAESGGNPTGPCASRVTLKRLIGPTLGNGFEFLQGLTFEASNIKELTASDPTVATAIEQGAADYYTQVDPRGFRANFNGFISKNHFGQPQTATDVEFDAQYANSGDLGFGRDMHCRKNLAADGKFDVACYVTNYGQPPANIADQTDADNAFTHTNPDATVAMEFSRVENATGVNPEFPDDERAVKFYVFNAQIPTNPPIIKADLDGVGERPVPQLCVTCHGGQVASVAADAADPGGPKKGAFQARGDIMSMRSNFLPFDLHYYNFPSGKSKAAQETAFKDLNEKIVKQVATDSGPTGAAIVELIEALYFGNSPTQLTDAVVTNWDKANPASDSNRFYRQVFGPACRTCHTAQPYTAPAYTSKIDFHADIVSVQNRVCSQKIMPHAKRTNELFWTSLAPNMPAYLQLYGQTLPGWDSSTPGAQCGLFYEAGATVPSAFATNVFPIFSNNCTGCHSATGNANFAVSGGPTATYNSLLNSIAKNGTSHYITANSTANSLLYQRITTGAIGFNVGDRMPQGGDLSAADKLTIQQWINAGAPGP